MLPPPLPRSTRRVQPWPGVLLACLLGVLLLAATHCSSYFATDGHRHLSLSAPATPDGHAGPSDGQEYPDLPQHDHGSACVSPCPTTWTSPGGPQRPADTPAAPPSPEVAALPVEQATSAAFCSGRPSIARTGRSTLAAVCRWRI